MRHELDTEKSPDHGKIDLIAAECTKRGVQRDNKKKMKLICDRKCEMQFCLLREQKISLRLSGVEISVWVQGEDSSKGL